MLAAVQVVNVTMMSEIIDFLLFFPRQLFNVFSHFSIFSTSRTLQLEIQVSPQTSVSSLSELSPSISEGEEHTISAASSTQSISDLNENITIGECGY